MATAYNKAVTASPPVGGSGYEKPQSGLRPFVRFFSATFFCLRETASQFPNRKQKNVSYRQTLHDNFFTPRLFIAPRHPWRGGFILFKI
jgi:hypothetical protein